MAEAGIADVDVVGKIRPTRQGLIIDPNMRFGAKSLAAVESVRRMFALRFARDDLYLL